MKERDVFYGDKEPLYLERAMEFAGRVFVAVVGAPVRLVGLVYGNTIGRLFVSNAFSGVLDERRHMSERDVVVSDSYPTAPKFRRGN